MNTTLRSSFVVPAILVGSAALSACGSNQIRPDAAGGVPSVDQDNTSSVVNGFKAVGRVPGQILRGMVDPFFMADVTAEQAFKDPEGAIAHCEKLADQVDSRGGWVHAGLTAIVALATVPSGMPGVAVPLTGGCFIFCGDRIENKKALSCPSKIEELAVTFEAQLKELGLPIPDKVSPNSVIFAPAVP